MATNDFFEIIRDRIRIFANKHCEIVKCRQCGRDYPSRGKKDIGICPECIKDGTFIGGALDDSNRS